MKESRDSRDVFAVFKADSFMKDATFGEKLRYWFKNVLISISSFAEPTRLLPSSAYTFAKIGTTLVMITIITANIIIDIIIG